MFHSSVTAVMTRFVSISLEAVSNAHTRAVLMSLSGASSVHLLFPIAHAKTELSVHSMGKLVTAVLTTHVIPKMLVLQLPLLVLRHVQLTKHALFAETRSVAA